MSELASNTAVYKLAILPFFKQECFLKLNDTIMPLVLILSFLHVWSFHTWAAKRWCEYSCQTQKATSSNGLKQEQQVIHEKVAQAFSLLALIIIT